MDDDESEEKRKRDLEHQLKRAREPLDHSPSSGPPGSEQKSYDVESPTLRDGRSMTHTTFYANDEHTPLARSVGNEETDCIDKRFNSSKQRWEWLRKVNNGTGHNDHIKENAAVNKSRDVDIVCSALDATDQQKSRINGLLKLAHDDRERGLFFGPQRPIEVVIIAAATLAINEDGRPLQQNISREEPDSLESYKVPSQAEGIDFEMVATAFIPESIDEPLKEVQSVRKQLRSYL